MSIYQKQHYKDVAEILRRWQRSAEQTPAARLVMHGIQGGFIGLFAADNPACCLHCSESKTTTRPCVSAGGRSYDEHNFEGGFDREWFLKACGVEPGYTAMRAMQELGLPDPEDIPLSQDEQLED